MKHSIKKHDKSRSNRSNKTRTRQRAGASAYLWYSNDTDASEYDIVSGFE